ncbi:MAG: MFS transporter, partial [Bryobacteraceae bacterium]
MLILVLGVSPMLAPLIGSYLLDWFGWTSIFWAQGFVGALCAIAVHFRLAESMPMEARRPLSLEQIRSGYRTLLSDRTFVGAALVCGFSSAGMFSYIASAPFVLIDLYKLPPHWFGWLFGAIATGIITASQINGRMPHRIPVRSVLRRANLAQCLAGGLVLAAVVADKGGIPGLFIPVFMYMFAAGFVFPNGSTLAMIRHGKIAGSASALLGTIQYAIAAVAVIGLGEIHSKTALPMAVGIAFCGVAATAVNFLTLRGQDDPHTAHP